MIVSFLLVSFCLFHQPFFNCVKQDVVFFDSLYCNTEECVVETVEVRSVPDEDFVLFSQIFFKC